MALLTRFAIAFAPASGRLDYLRVGVYRNVPKNIFHNAWKCTEKAISKVIWVGKGALDAILSQINKKIGDRFHFQ